ncbi:uncharacterized protein LOC128980491 [Indicator indicator]|uniref:uncharacterized protein LOC128980491 n=1 Tax=Indicator indicator TaxID=1002788 RepID=UPI0023DED561|nr:uncharacterized protein LOC128980491 [Indicator indicator]
MTRSWVRSGCGSGTGGVGGGGGGGGGHSTAGSTVTGDDWNAAPRRGASGGAPTARVTGTGTARAGGGTSATVRGRAGGGRGTGGVGAYGRGSTDGHCWGWGGRRVERAVGGLGYGGRALRDYGVRDGVWHWARRRSGGPGEGRVLLTRGHGLNGAATRWGYGGDGRTALRGRGVRGGGLNATLLGRGGRRTTGWWGSTLRLGGAEAGDGGGGGAGGEVDAGAGRTARVRTLGRSGGGTAATSYVDGTGRRWERGGGLRAGRRTAVTRGVGNAGRGASGKACVRAP